MSLAPKRRKPSLWPRLLALLGLSLVASRSSVPPILVRKVERLFDIGLSRSQVAKAIATCPQILGFSVEKKLVPTIEVLANIGLSRPQVAKVTRARLMNALVSLDQILGFSLESKTASLVTADAPLDNKALEVMVNVALDGKALRDEANCLEPDYSSHDQIISSTLATVRHIAHLYFGNGSAKATVKMIGSRNYGIDIKGSDIDFVLSVGRICFSAKAWRNFAEELNKSLEGCPVINGNKAISIHLNDGPVLQFVPRYGPFEFDKVLCPNLIATFCPECRNRMVVEKRLKKLFESYPGARNVMRVLKQFFLPLLVKRLPEQPWSSILTLIVAREACCSGYNATDDVDGVELYLQVLQELSSCGASPSTSSTQLVQNWANNEGKNVEQEVRECLRILRTAARQIQDGVEERNYAR
ncbi:Putative E3 ubiquitin-protein ligase HERC1 [Durusdinium trenchii]|uniref:E3 ubiquitin-protein ligase HERC1 n=1 Tax=Durusdinium trenchii TaxID=1381693 RepID=A0ABP0K4M1_9DINO